MEFLSFVVIVAFVVAVILAVCLAFSDGDLTLMFCERYGKSLSSLAGKVVWVTGASSGIGRALAVKLASVRCRVVISARREVELNTVKEECLAVGLSEKDILVLPMDVTDIGRHQEWLQQIIDRFGQLDVLVNNAGRSQRAMFEDVDIRVDRELFELNVFSQVALTTTVLKRQFLERKAGHIAVTTSVAGKSGVPMSRAYTGSKHALHGYFECLRVEHPFLGITLLCPGPVVSEIVKNAFTGTADEVFGLSHDSSDKRMSAERCAHLSAVAIANNLDEAWISIHPALILLYAAQYIPTLSRWIMRKKGMEYAMKVRDGNLVKP